jgi:subtilisin family serine protease
MLNGKFFDSMNFNRHYVAAIFAAFLLVTSCTEFQDQEIKKSNPVAGSNYVEGELLINIRTGSAGSRVSSDILSLVEGELVEEISTQAMAQTRARISAPAEQLLLVKSPLGTMEAINRLKGNPDVIYAEPNFIYNHFDTSDDTYYLSSQLWGMYGDASTPSNQYGSQAAEAWANGKIGSGTVYIGIIDEGYMYTHEDIAANAGVNPGEIAGDKIDNDKNGYVDDVYGWDFDGKNNTVFDGTQDDHGTHVSGTIGAVGANGKGVAGMVWNVKLLSGKFLGVRGGTTSNAVKAVDYFTALKNNGLNIIATNNSWGGGGFSQALQDAIERANTANILFVAAAGNGGSDGIGDNNDNVTNYPSNYPNANVIAVAAITSGGALTSFSNYGATKVDIGAPGSGIYSSLPGKGGTSTYGSYSGTSMATPHVTGACALYASINPNATAAQIKSAILSAATPTSSLDGKCVSNGRLNVGGF